MLREKNEYQAIKDSWHVNAWRVMVCYYNTRGVCIVCPYLTTVVKKSGRVMAATRRSTGYNLPAVRRKTKRKLIDHMREVWKGRQKNVRVQLVVRLSP